MKRPRCCATRRANFALANLAPIADKTDAENLFPRQLWPKFGELGLFGITVPQEDGGAGMSYLQHIVVLEEMTRCSGAIGMSYGTQSNLVLNQLKLNATPEQKARYMPRLISGEHVGALAMTEASAGSDIVGMRLQRREARRPLHPQRLEDVDHQFVRSRRSARLRQDRSGGRQGRHLDLHQSRRTFRDFASPGEWTRSACAVPAPPNSCSTIAKFRLKISSASSTAACAC